jgi:hypothetical protein
MHWEKSARKTATYVVIASANAYNISIPGIMTMFDGPTATSSLPLLLISWSVTLSVVWLMTMVTMMTLMESKRYPSKSGNRSDYSLTSSSSLFTLLLVFFFAF